MGPSGFTRCQPWSLVSIFLISFNLWGEHFASPTNNAEVNIAQESWSEPSVNILSVERDPAPGGAKFSIRFSKNDNVNSAEVFARVYDNQRIPQDPDSLTEGADGVWLAEITVDRDAPRWRAPWVYIGNNDDYMVGLELQNFQSTSVSQETIITPVLYVRPALEAVYQPGRDMLVEVSSPYQSDANAFYTYFTGVDLSTNTFHYDFEDMDLFNKTDRETLQDRIQQNVTILTSVHPVSGLLEVTKYEDNTGGSVVRQIMVSKYVKVRPSNQASYLPPGFLAFDERSYYPRSADGNELFSCRNISTCKPTCRAVGESLTDLQVFQVMPGGVYKYAMPQRPPAIRDTFRRIYWQINNEDGSLKEGDFLRYDCIAIDSINQNVVSKTVDVSISPGALN